MADDHFDRVDSCLASRELGSLIGLEEGIRFEAKRAAAYRIDSAASRYELAKDVSALANANGGMIVIGVATERAESEMLDRVSALDLVPPDAVKPSALEGIIREHVHPPIPDLSVSWVEDVAGRGLGVVVIRVPAQQHDVKPFLTLRVVEDGHVIKQTVVGYAIRVESGAEPFSPTRLHEAMKQGMNSVAQRLDRLEAKLDALIESRETQASEPRAVAPSTPDLVLLNERIARLLGDAE
ncbi:MAG: ATP-binding protein [Gemmatirosa sp.]|nr:ATP-binding protein [Gemmatirosa sp.]